MRNISAIVFAAVLGSMLNVAVASSGGVVGVSPLVMAKSIAFDVVPAEAQVLTVRANISESVIERDLDFGADLRCNHPIHYHPLGAAAPELRQTEHIVSDEWLAVSGKLKSLDRFEDRTLSFAIPIVSDEWLAVSGKLKSLDRFEDRTLSFAIPISQG